MPNTNHTHSVTAAGSIGDKTAGGSISATFTGQQAKISSTFTGTKANTGKPNETIGVASSEHTHNVTATGTVSKPSFTGTAANIKSGGAILED